MRGVECAGREKRRHTWGTRPRTRVHSKVHVRGRLEGARAALHSGARWTDGLAAALRNCLSGMLRLSTPPGLPVVQCHAAYQPRWKFNYRGRYLVAEGEEQNGDASGETFDGADSLGDASLIKYRNSN